MGVIDKFTRLNVPTLATVFPDDLSELYGTRFVVNSSTTIVLRLYSGPLFLFPFRLTFDRLRTREYPKGPVRDYYSCRRPTRVRCICLIKVHRRDDIVRDRFSYNNLRTDQRPWNLFQRNRRFNLFRTRKFTLFILRQRDAF